MPSQAPGDKLRFVLQGSFIAAYPSATAPKPNPASRTTIWLVVFVCAILSLGIAAECALRSARRRQAASPSPSAGIAPLAPVATAPAPDTGRSARQASEATARPVEYIVKGGDTLGRIALRHGCTLEELADANGFSLSHLPVIRIGQRLRIPTPRPKSPR